MKILAIIQARASSTRLPGKVLKTILGKTLIELQVERVLKSKYIDKLILATSTSPEDEAIEKICNQISIECFRGSLDNVLDRFYQAAVQYKPEHVVRLTGDCPLSDPLVIDDLIKFYLEAKCDYAANCVKPHYPDGLDAEIFTFKSLKRAHSHAVLPSHLEHVTPYIRQEKSFNILNYDPGFDHSDLRWTVDEAEDFVLIKKIFEEIYPQKPDFGFNDVLDFMEQEPELKTYNKKYERNEGLKKSLTDDSKFTSKINDADNIK